MKVGTARAAATQWVMRHAHHDPAFRGAFFSGSTVPLPDDAELPPESDIDVIIVTADEEPLPKPGKFPYQDTLVEVTPLPWTQLRTADRVLATYYLAGSFRTNTIIADPTGHLRDLHHHVSRHFTEPPWIRRRCDHVQRRIEHGLQNIDPTAPWHDQFTTWLFATGVTTHVLLVAALRNPTVRLRYLATRDTLTDHGRPDLYPALLELLGCARLTPRRVAHHLHELTSTFDAAAHVARTPFFFSTDITPTARPIAIDASQRLIDNGCHREAMFWIMATFARCHTILATDAEPHVRHTHTPAFDAATADLGITSTRDLLHRAEDVTQFLPPLRTTAETILSSHGPP